MFFQSADIFFGTAPAAQVRYLLELARIDFLIGENRAAKTLRNAAILAVHNVIALPTGVMLRVPGGVEVAATLVATLALSVG